jgi:hypothetical protein
MVDVAAFLSRYRVQVIMSSGQVGGSVAVERGGGGGREGEREREREREKGRGKERQKERERWL